jgi:hypothetical protein
MADEEIQKKALLPVIFTFLQLLLLSGQRDGYF